MISLPFGVMKGLPRATHTHSSRYIIKFKREIMSFKELKFDTMGRSIRGQPQWVDVQGSNRLNSTTQKHLL